jgi:hypothetical protein
LENNARQPNSQKHQANDSLGKRVNLLSPLYNSCEAGIEVDGKVMMSENQSN